MTPREIQLLLLALFLAVAPRFVRTDEFHATQASSGAAITTHARDSGSRPASAATAPDNGSGPAALRNDPRAHG